jgi:hypothetical protein
LRAKRRESKLCKSAVVCILSFNRSSTWAFFRKADLTVESVIVVLIVFIIPLVDGYGVLSGELASEN